MSTTNSPRSQPFPVVPQPDTVYVASLADIDRMAKQAARKRVLLPLNILSNIMFAALLMSIALLLTIGTSAVVPVTLATAVVSLACVPVSSALTLRRTTRTFRQMLVGGIADGPRTYATTFGPQSFDIAVDGAQYLRFSYSDIGRTIFLDDVIVLVLPANVAVWHLIPRAAVGQDGVFRSWTPGGPLHPEPAFPIIDAPDAVAHVTAHEVGTIAKNGARHHTSRRPLLVGCLGGATAFLLGMAGSLEFTASLSTATAAGLAVASTLVVASLYSTRLMFTLVLTRCTTRPMYTYAATFGIASADIANDGIEYRRIEYRQIRRLEVLKKSVLVYEYDAQPYALPRALVTEGGVQQMANASVQVIQSRQRD